MKALKNKVPEGIKSKKDIEMWEFRKVSYRKAFQLIKSFNLIEDADENNPDKPIWMKFDIACAADPNLEICIPDVIYYNVKTEMWSCYKWEVKQNYITWEIDENSFKFTNG